MEKFKKLLDHPEYDKIIDKLFMGETPKDVSEYLRHKYSKPDENHLRLSVSLLDDFVKNYANTSDFMEKLVIDAKTGVLDKKISESLLNNKTWKARIADLADEKINIERKIIEQFNMMEQRQEQIFDKIQENPGNTKLDYILTKYFELTSMLMEKADRIINKSPDQRIEHTYTVQMVEQHSGAIQEAVRRMIARLPPELATECIQILAEEMNSIKAPTLDAPITVKSAAKDVALLEEKASKLDEKIIEMEFEDEDEDEDKDAG